MDTPHGPPPSGGNTRFHLNIPPELVASSNHFTERFLTTGNTALDTVSGSIRFADINPEDLPTVTVRFDSFVYRNAQQDIIVTSSLTLEQLAAIERSQVPLSVIPDPDNTNIGEATWIYSVADHALDFLAAGETLTLTYMARVDTNYSEYNTVVFKPFTITITGTNDLPTAAATGSGIIELDRDQQPRDRSCRGHDYLCGCRPDGPADRDRAVRELCLYRGQRLAADADTGAADRARGGADADAGGDQHQQRFGGVVV